jgi:hypothetical protein
MQQLKKNSFPPLPEESPANTTLETMTSSSHEREGKSKKSMISMRGEGTLFLSIGGENIQDLVLM